jgi:HEPN domain-containing protein
MKGDACLDATDQFEYWKELSEYDLGTIPPKTHNIRSLANDFEDSLAVPIPSTTKEFFDVLTMHYLNNRYPDYKASLAADLTRRDTRSILKQTEATYKWLLTLKK